MVLGRPEALMFIVFGRFAQIASNLQLAIFGPQKRGFAREKERGLVREPLNRETDFYAPPVLGGAALFDYAAPAVYKNHVPSGPRSLYTADAELSERAAPPSTGGV